MKKISLLLLLLITLLTGCSTEKPQEQPEIIKQIEVKQTNVITIQKDNYSDTYIKFIKWYDDLSNQEKNNVNDELEKMLNKNYEYKDEERLEISY